MVENIRSRQANPLAASNKATGKHELKSTESLNSLNWLNQISIYNNGEQSIESEPDITHTTANRSTNLIDGKIV